MDNDLKKIIIAVLVSGIIGLSGVIFTLIKDVNTLKSECETSVSALNKMEIAVESLKKNRESLSDYYVTRREFSSAIEQQNTLLSGLDRKLEKLTDVFYRKNPKDSKRIVKGYHIAGIDQVIDTEGLDAIIKEVFKNISIFDNSMHSKTSLITTGFLDRFIIIGT